MPNSNHPYLSGQVRDLLMPSGYKFIVRRPNTFWFLEHSGELPISPAAVNQLPGDQALPTVEETIARAKWIKELVEHCVLEPTIRDNPGEGEISPYDLTPEDAEFLINFLTGKVTDGGRDLEAFRDGAKSTDAGTDRGAVRTVAIGAAGNGPDAVSS